MKKLPSFLKPVMEAAKPAAFGLGAVGVGAVGAQVGSAVLKAASPGIASFAARSAMHEAGVDLAAGVGVSIAATAGVAAWKGANAARLAAPLFLVGAAGSAILPVAQPYITSAADKVVSMLMPSAAPGGYLPEPGFSASLGVGGSSFSSDIDVYVPGGVEGSGYEPSGNFSTDL